MANVWPLSCPARPSLWSSRSLPHFVSATHGGPVVLFALLIGMAFNFLGAEACFAPGLAFASRTVLRVGGAMLGARITLDEVAEPPSLS